MHQRPGNLPRRLDARNASIKSARNAGLDIARDVSVRRFGAESLNYESAIEAYALMQEPTRFSDQRLTLLIKPNSGQRPLKSAA